MEINVNAIESMLRQAGIPFTTSRNDDGSTVIHGKVVSQPAAEAEKSALERYDDEGGFVDPLTNELYEQFQTSIYKDVDARYNDITDIHQVLDAVAGVMLDTFVGFHFSPDEAKKIFSDIVDACSETRHRQ